MWREVLSAALVIAVSSSAAPATAEVVVSAYGGGTLSSAGEVHYLRAGDTDLHFDGVEWESEPFTLPIYYGFRVGYWLPDRSRWGLALDFTHDKLLAETERTVSVRGRREGNPVDGNERLGDTFSTLAFSHGHNLLVGQLLRRWGGEARGQTASRSRVAPYMGGGLGFTVPHVEITTGGDRVEEYQFSGPVLAALAGVEFRFGSRVRPLAEYRTSYAWLVGGLPDGGQVELQPWTHHLIVGLSFALFGP